MHEQGFNRRLYTTFFRRNTMFVGSIFVAAFAFEIAYDKVTDYIWDSNNKGKQWKDIKDKYAQ
ncbi:cytochrome b-c1 complex subunit 9 [Paraphysoderma sedebokerense]|nr:cytochrome b-c1 complex subunit 9 [Paraphysoderma sedebokerense]